MSFADNRLYFAAGKTYISETTRFSDSQPLRATNRVLECEGLLSKILSFTGPMLEYYKYAPVSKAFNTAWMARDVSLCIIAHYDKSKLRSLEAFTDPAFLRKQSVNIVHSLGIQHLLSIAPRIVDQEGESRLVVHGTLAAIPWYILGAMIFDNNLTPEQRRRLRENDW